jgi:hypothetical protein
MTKVIGDHIAGSEGAYDGITQVLAEIRWSNVLQFV